MTGENGQRVYGYTYSDITQKILPALVLEAFPDSEITYKKIVELLNRVSPTPPFNESSKI